MRWRRRRRGRWWRPGGLSSASLSWGAATDNVGVVRYNVHRSTTPGFTPSLANRVAQPTGTSYTDTGRGGHLLLPGHRRGRGRQRRRRPRTRPRRRSATRRRPRRRGRCRRTGSVGKATLSWGAATDNVGVLRYNVHRGTSSGFTPSLANRIAQPTGTSYVDTTAPGTYFYKVTAEDAAGNIGAASNEAAATVTADTTAPSAPTGLAAPVTGSTANLSWTALQRRRRRRPLQRPPRHERRLHPQRRQPDRASRPAPATPTPGSRPAPTTTRSPPKTPPATSAPPPTKPTATVADATPPSAPGTLTATANGTTINLSWSAATDNVAVSRYNVHRGTTSGFTPTAGNRIGQPTGLSYADPGLAPGTYFYKVTAEDAAGNVGPLQHRQRHRRRHHPAQHPHPERQRRRRPGRAHLDRLDRQRRRRPLQRPPRHHRGFTPTTANRIAQPTGTSYTDTGLAAGTYFYKVTAEDAAGNISAASNQASATVTAPPTTGLVAAYGFDAGSGTTPPTSPATATTARSRTRRGRHRRQVRQRALLQRHERARHRPRLQLARSHHGHDARGLGQPDGTRPAGGRSSSRSGQATWSTASTRAPTPTGRSRRSRRRRGAAPQRNCRVPARRSGRTSPPRTTGRHSACT